MSEERHTRQLVVFALDGEQYALPIERVREIIRYQPPRSIASAEPWVRGVLNLRGALVPVYDLAGELGASTAVGGDKKIVIVDAGGETIGIIVDAVEEVLMVDPEQLDHVPARGSAMIDSIVKLDDRLIVLLDPSIVLGTEAHVA